MSAEPFNRLEFLRFCNNLRIDTKEKGSVMLGKTFMGSQRRAINEIAAGAEQGKREFVILKARQLGISTMLNALDLYWIGKHRGITGALIVHDEPGREQFRTTLEMYYQSLPNSMKRRVRGTKFGNRNQVVFQHGSRLIYRVAGTKGKKSSTLGRSAALSYLHATEVAFWGNPDDVDSLVSTLAQENPSRFYTWETTANGFNFFWDMWNGAKDSATKKAIFIGFWANEFYRAPRDSDVFKMYWGKSGKLSKEERTMVKEVKQLYDYQIDEEQIAWYRWYLREKCDGNEIAMWQEMPHTEYAAFVATGSAFFTARKLGDAYQRLLEESAPKYCRFEIGATFSDTQIISSNSQSASLKVWEGPVKGAYYVLGADPAYGSSESADRYAISVWRAYADRLEQVAEYCSTSGSTADFAWVMIYLASWYEPCVWTLEVNGPGQAVLSELQNMTRQRSIGPLQNRKALEDAMKKISTYLYQRYDSLYRSPSAIHTMTTFQQKERYMGSMKDYFERDFLRVRSRDLLDEMKHMIRENGSAPAADTRSKDDRVIAAALAIIAWNDQLRSRLIVLNETHAHVESRGAIEMPTEVGSRLVADMFRKIGFTEGIDKPVMPGVQSGIAARHGGRAST